MKKNPYLKNSALLFALLTAVSNTAVARELPNTDNTAANTHIAEASNHATEHVVNVPETITPDILNIAALEQKERALSKRPKVVGKEKLDKEAKGLRKLSKQAIQNWRDGRLNPSFSAD